MLREKRVLYNLVGFFILFHNLNGTKTKLHFTKIQSAST